jgi:hypothetical protein
MKNYFIYAGITAVIILFSACDRDDEEIIVHDLEPGTFEASITGDVESVFEGVAIYTEYLNQVTGEFFFTIGLGSTTANEAISLWFIRSGEYPGDGTYNIQSIELADLDNNNEWFFEQPDFVILSVRQPDQEVELYFSDSGSITLEQNEANTVTGEFELTATGSLMNQTETQTEGEENNEEPEVWEIVITGTFNAAFGEVPLPAFNNN